MDERRQPVRIGRLLRGTGARLGLDGSMDVGILASRWTDLVGPQLAQHVEPTSLRNGVLRLRAASPIWATEVGYLADRIVAAANETLGRPEVSQVRIWCGPGTARTEPASAGTRSQGRPAAARASDEPAPPADAATAFARARAAFFRRASGGGR